MPNLREKTWTTTTPATVEDAQFWEDHLISDLDVAAIGSAVQSVNNTTPDENGNVTLSIPAAQVNSDWNSSSGVSEILNKPTIPTVSVAGSGTASSTVTHQQQITINSVATDIDGTVYMENTANASTFTFTNAVITSNSVIDGPYTDTYGDTPSNVVVDGSNNTCTVTFNVAQSRTVRIYIR